MLDAYGTVDFISKRSEALAFIDDVEDSLIAILESKGGAGSDVADKAREYLQYLVWGLPFSSMAIGVRFYCDGQKNVVPATVIAIIVVLVNICLNYCLMFGKLGLPAMDVAGCGLATGISMALSFALFLFYVQKSPRYRSHRLFACL